MAGEEVVFNEDWFLAQLEAEVVEPAPLLAWLGELRAAGRADEAEAHSALLLDVLRGRQAVDKALDVVRWRAEGWAGGPDGRARAREEVLSVLGVGSESQVLVEEAGFASEVPLAECFRRLKVLRALKPEVLCYEKTWGLGLVRRVDFFYRQVVVDFERRKDHRLALGYAGQVLQILPEEHLLACHYRDPAGVAARAREHPAEVVRHALRSYGPLTVAQLKDILVPRILAEADWKAFWESARKALKEDACVEVPAKRTEPLRLLDRARAFDAEWFAALRGERVLETLLERISELVAQVPPGALDAGARETLSERLGYVFRGADARHPEYAAQAVLRARELGVRVGDQDPESLLERYLEPAVFREAVTRLPARDVPVLLAQLHEVARERAERLLLEVLPELEWTGLNAALDLLLVAGREAEVAQAIRRLTEGQQADVEVLYWLVRHPEKLGAWGLGTAQDLARWILRALEREHRGARRKARNLLQERFERAGWLEDVLAAMPPGERRDFGEWLFRHPAWPVLDRRAMLGRLVKTFPDLRSVLAAEAGEAPGRRQGDVTSRRSYAEKRTQLERIVNVDLPRLSREIARARGYGDLSENYEYKAAKEAQALLLRRRAELEQMLQRVRPTDFEQSGNPEVAGTGTRVTLEWANGRRATFHILGVWDSDEALGIVSSQSPLAKALEGRRAGEEVRVPSAEGDAPARIVEIGPLPESVRAWARGEPEGTARGLEEA